MRRSPALPFETVAAIALVVAASLAALVVVVRDVTDDAGSERLAVDVADRSAVTAAPEDPEAPPPPPPAPATPGEPADPPAAPDPGAATGSPATTTTTTTTTVASPPPTRTSPPTSRVEEPPQCPGLESESHWIATGEPSMLLAGAGGEADYAEVVVNTGDEPCTLETNRCGSTAELRTDMGESVDVPDGGCPSDGRPVTLRPGEERTERLTASFPVPPGTYSVHIRRYDGTVIALPVHLDDRIPACAADDLALEVNGSDQARRRSELQSLGFRLDLVILAASQDCSVRTVESLVHLERDGEQIETVDSADRWLARTGELDDRIRTHAAVPAGDVPPGDYDGQVTVVLESGDRLSAPFTLQVG